MIQAKTCVSPIGIPEIVPERVDAFSRMKLPDSIRPALPDQLAEGLTRFDAEECIVLPPLRLVDIKLSWHDVVVPR